MENKDRERILKSAERNAHLRRLYNEHMKFEERLAQMSKRPFLTAEEQQEEIALKRRKLRGVDQMMALLSAEPHAMEAH